jgi:hypothetical protein
VAGAVVGDNDGGGCRGCNLAGGVIRFGGTWGGGGQIIAPDCGVVQADEANRQKSNSRTGCWSGGLSG